MRLTDRTTGNGYFRKKRRRFDGDLAPRELTFSCFRGFPFLAKNRTRTWFVEALEEYRSSWPVDLWAYVIMPEHVHLLVAPRNPDVKIGRFVGKIKEKTSRQAIAWLEVNAREWLPRITVKEGKTIRRRFWQPGGGYDRNVEELKTLQSMINYIHLNPVRRRLVEQPEDWEWSSARFYADRIPVKIAMDRTLPTFVE